MHKYKREYIHEGVKYSVTGGFTDENFIGTEVNPVKGIARRTILIPKALVRLPQHGTFFQKGT